MSFGDWKNEPPEVLVRSEAVNGRLIEELMINDRLCVFVDNIWIHGASYDEVVRKERERDHGDAVKTGESS